MNTKIYKKVHTLAIELLKADDKEDEQAFTRLYQELKALCYDNEGNETKNHPVQWETLADFTEDTAQAISLYQKALQYAQLINAKDFLASANYSLASMMQEMGMTEQASIHAREAETHARKIVDKELQKEIQALLKSLK